MKILVIEDNQEVRENIQELLELSEYTVITAPDGKAGVITAKQELPDLIICDIMMPELDGYGVLQLLSRNTQTNKIPFIFLTAKTENSDFRKGMNLGADDYITKPFEEMDLINAIEARRKRSKALHTEEPANATQQLNTFIKKAKLEDVISEKTIKHYKKSETIFKEGDYPNYVHLLQKGKVKLSRINSDGKEFIFSLVKEGDYFGYQAVIASHNFQDTATTLEPSELISISHTEFEELLQGNPEISARFIQMLSNEVEDKEQELIDLAYNTVRKRVVDNLLKLKEKYQENEASDFSMKISRGDLASMTGTAKESVIRYLSELKSEGLISIEKSEITIVDEAGLRKIMF